MKSLYLGSALAVLATAAWAADPKSDDTQKSKDSSSQTYNLGSTDQSGSKSSIKSGEANAKDLQQIKDLANNVAKGFNENDAQAAASNFAEDATLINAQGKRAEGRDAIQKQFKEDLSGPMKGQKFTFTNIQVKMLKPDVAYFDLDQQTTPSEQGQGEQGQGQQLGQSQNGQQAQQPVHVSGVVVKQAGKWIIQEARPATYLQEQPSAAS